MSIRMQHIAGSPELRNPIVAMESIPMAKASIVSRVALPILSMLMSPRLVLNLVISKGKADICKQELLDRGNKELVSFLENIYEWSACTMVQILKDLSGISLAIPVVQQALESLLPVMIFHLQQQAQVHHAKTEDAPPYLMADSLSYLIETVHSHLSSIQEKLDDIGSKQRTSRNQSELNALFRPLADELLRLFFPHKSSDLPFPWGTRKKIWNALSDLFPQVLCHFYFQIKAPLEDGTEQKINQYPDGDVINAIAQLSEEKVALLIPSLLRREDNKRSMVTDIVAKNIVGMVNPSAPHTKSMVHWVANQLENLADERVHVHKLWNLIARFVSSSLRHAMLHLLMSDQRHCFGETPAIARIVSVILEQVHIFWDQKGEVIRQAAKPLQQSDDAFIQLFNPFVDNILKVLGMASPEELPLPEMLRPVSMRILRKVLPTLIANYYLHQSKIKMQITPVNREIRNLLFDCKWLEDNKLAIETITELFHENVPHEEHRQAFYHKLWEKSGTHDIAAAIEQTLTNVSSNILEVIWNYLHLPKLEESPFYALLYDHLHKNVDYTLRKITLNILKNTPLSKQSQDHPHPKYALPAEFLFRFMSFVYEPQATDISLIVAHVSERLHQLLSPNPLDHLPFHGLPAADELSQAIWSITKSAILPHGLHNLCLDLRQWIDDAEKNRENLQCLYHSTYLAESCRVLAIYSVEFIKNYLFRNHYDVGRLLTDLIESYFSEQVDRKHVEDILSRNIQLFAESEKPHVEFMWSAAVKYMEALFLVFFSRLSERFADQELKDPDFLIDTVIILLKDITQHFSTLNRLVQQAGTEVNTKSRKDHVLSKFGAALHPGAPSRQDLTPEEEDRVRMDGFFIPTMNKIQNLIRLDEMDLPLPRQIRPLLGRVILQQIAPNILMNVFKSLMAHGVRDHLMLGMTTMWYSAINTIQPVIEQEAPKDASRPLTEKEIHLHEACGALIQEVVKLFPDELMKDVFMIEKVKKLSKRTIGEAVFGQLNKSTLLQLIDKVVYAGLPALHLSKWEGKTPLQEKLVPRILKPNGHGQMELYPSSRFTFTFPKTQEEVRLHNKEHHIQEIQTRRQLRAMFTQTISAQVTQKVRDYILYQWQQFQTSLDRFIASYSPTRGPKMKVVLDEISHRVFVDGVGPILGFLAAPLFRFCIFIVEKVYIDKKSDEIIDCIHSETLENLVFQATDRFFSQFSESN